MHRLNTCSSSVHTTQPMTRGRKSARSVHTTGASRKCFANPKWDSAKPERVGGTSFVIGIKWFSFRARENLRLMKTCSFVFEHALWNANKSFNWNKSFWCDWIKLSSKSFWNLEFSIDKLIWFCFQFCLNECSITMIKTLSVNLRLIDICDIIETRRVAVLSDELIIKTTSFCKNCLFVNQLFVIDLFLNFSISLERIRWLRSRNEVVWVERVLRWLEERRPREANRRFGRSRWWWLEA